MPPPPKTAAVVLLAGADDAGVAALQPSAEVLAGFGIAVETMVVANGGVDATRFEGTCAVIVASPDGALPAALAASTKLPVIRVPTATAERSGLKLLKDDADDLPSGEGEVSFATMAIGVAGAKNAALFVVAVLALEDERIRAEYAAYRAKQTAAVLNHPPLEV